MRCRAFLVALLGATIWAAATVATAAAENCVPTASCYAIYEWKPTTSYTGGIATVNATRMSVPSPGTRKVNEEMWVGTNESATSNTWVEAGLKYGFGADGQPHGLITFWEEKNTLGQTGFIVIGSAALGSSYTMKISYSGSSSWGVYQNGQQHGGTSHNQPCCSRYFAAGAEYTADAAQLTGTVSGLQKRGSDNSTWSNNWGTGGIFTLNWGATAGWTSGGSAFWNKVN
jgi:hypothetical protein